MEFQVPSGRFQKVLRSMSLTPAHIFMNQINVLHFLSTQIKHSTLYNCHQDQTILTFMVEILQSRTQVTTLHNLRAHTNNHKEKDHAQNLEILTKEFLKLERWTSNKNIDCKFSTSLRKPYNHRFTKNMYGFTLDNT